MARVVLRRRPRALSARPLTALTSAATRIQNPQTDLANKIQGGARDDWADKAWGYVRCVGELDYYVRWRSNAVSRARLTATAIDPLTGQPGPLDEQDRNAATVQQIVRDIGGSDQPQILKRLASFLTVPGEGFVALAVNPETGREKWFALSKKELTRSGADVTLILPDGSKHLYVPDRDVLLRVWDPDPEQAAKPTSPVRANLDVLQEIVRATATIDNAASSRLLGKGIVAIDDRVNLPAQAAPLAARDDNPDPEPEYLDTTASDLQDLLYNVATTAHKDPASMAALTPVFVTASGVETDKLMHHYKFETDIPEVALKTRSEAIRRLALGLDVSPERLLGMGSASNHWGAWLVADEDVKLHIVPVLELMCAAFTEHVLRPQLESLGIDPDTYAVGYDTTALTQDPDRKGEALAAHARGAITNRALNRYLGFTEEDEYQLDSLDGWKELIRDKAVQDLQSLLTLGPVAAPTDMGLPQTPVALPGSRGTTPTPAPGPVVEAEPVTEPAATTTAAAVRVLVNLCIRRALELAGNRMLTRSTRGTIPRDTPAHEYHQHVTPPAPSEVFRLIAGWDTVLDPSMFAGMGITREQLTRTVEAAAITTLTRGA